MITITNIGIRREPVDIKVNTSAKFRRGTHGDISFELELDGSNMYTIYNPSFNSSNRSIRFAAMDRLMQDIKSISKREETKDWKGCYDLGLYEACMAQARGELCNPFYSNKARETKEEIVNIVRQQKQSVFALSESTLNKIFYKYENFITSQRTLELEVDVWRTEVSGYQADEQETCDKIYKKLKEYLTERERIFDKTIRCEHMFTIHVDE